MSGKHSAMAAAMLCTGIALAWTGVSALLEKPARADTKDAPESVPLSAMNGRQIYEHICQGCHMADGGGAVGAGHYPALAKDPTLVSRQHMALTLLKGRRNMPAFGEKQILSPVEMGMLADWLRGDWYEPTPENARTAK